MKCLQYWPENHDMRFGPFIIKPDVQDVFEQFTIRRIIVEKVLRMLDLYYNIMCAVRCSPLPRESKNYFVIGRRTKASDPLSLHSLARLPRPCWHRHVAGIPECRNQGHFSRRRTDPYPLQVSVLKSVGRLYLKRRPFGEGIFFHLLYIKIHFPLVQIKEYPHTTLY